jgi:hypothetical protein
MRRTQPESRRTFDKAAFFEDMEYEPHPGQIPVHASTARRRVVACGVRWGKTMCAAMEGLAAAMVPAERSMGWVVAPTYDLADKVFREIELLVARHLLRRVIAIKEHEGRILLRNMAGGISEIRKKSAENPTSLLGEGLDWLIVDEAARLKPAIWEGHLSQRLIDRNGWALLISTPRGKGWYYDLFQRGKKNEPGHASWNAPSWENPFLDKKLIDAERTRLPERVFRQEYGGEFIEGSGQVFRYVRDCATGTYQAYNEKLSYYGGLDLARVEDFTVLVIMDDKGRVAFVDRFHRLDWSIQIARIHAATDQYRSCPVHVDSTGAGEPVVESLWHAGVNATPYPFTQASKADLMDNLAMLLERRELELPRPDVWPEGIDELEAFEYSVTDRGTVRTGAPYGQHDDCVVALALAAWNMHRYRDCRPHFAVIG